MTSAAIPARTNRPYTSPTFVWHDYTISHFSTIISKALCQGKEDMGAVFTVLIVLTCSLVVVRVATVGLTMTGLSKDLAQFQALSAFTGSGFTTRESEEI